MMSAATSKMESGAFRIADDECRDHPEVSAVEGARDPAHRPPLLAVRNLRKSYGGLQAVAGFDLTLTSRITGLIGPNGAGKTTVLNIVSGVERPDDGEVRFLDSHITAMPPHRLASLGLVRTFQLSRELTSLTVLENLLLARPRQTGESLFGLFAYGARVREEEQAALETARETLKKLGLWRHADAQVLDLGVVRQVLGQLLRQIVVGDGQFQRAYFH